MTSASRSLFRMLAVFVACYALLNLGYFWVSDAWLKEIAHHYGLLLPSASALNLFYGHGTVVIEDGGLVSQDSYLAVVRGCDGAGLMFLLSSAVMCYPTNWRSKFWGLTVALLLVYALNLARIIGLFVVFQSNRGIFANLHNVVIPLALLLICGAYFLWWSSAALRERVDQKSATT